MHADSLVAAREGQTMRTVEFRQERRQKPEDPLRREGDEADEGGPKRPDVEQPNRSRLLKRMKQVDKDQAKRYRQRTGQ